MSDVVKLHEPPNLLVGPFNEYNVVVEGRAIPFLTGRPAEGGRIEIIVDGRFSATFEPDIANQVAWLIGQGIAVASGYPSLNAESKSRPFAPQISELPKPPGEGQ